MKKAIVSVINDLSTDQRVDRSCLALEKCGYETLLVGRIKKDSLPLNERRYKMHRMKLFFEKGALFYAEYNIRLFLFLILKKTDLYFSNDLDTLLPNYILSRTKKIPLLFDSHEYFTETPELSKRLHIKKVWKTIESSLLPKLKSIITVNDSIAQLFRDEYQIKVTVVRNIPIQRSYDRLLTKEELNLPNDKKIILLQGAGINIHRGAEELVTSMQYIDQAILLIIGGGDVIQKLQLMNQKLKLGEKIRFIPKQSFEKLFNYTIHADLGLSIDKPTNLNYEYSLPNKLFDYINAGIPILATPLIELKKIIEYYKIGTFIDNHSPEHIASKISEILSDEKKLKYWRKNTLVAKKELNWRNEESILIKFIHHSTNI